MADDVFLEVHHFEPLVGKNVNFSNSPFTFPLVKIVKSQKFFEAAKRDPFILIFRSPKLEYYMTEGMRECAFEDGPTYSMYITPVFTPEPEWQDYQAVFN
jgi:hypothetical protein